MTVATRADQAVSLPQRRRRTELVMLAFALGVVLLAYGAVGLGLKGKLPPGLPSYVLEFAILMIAAHLAVRRWAPYADPLLLPLAALLNGLGIVMMYRLQESGNNGNPGNQVVELTSSSTALQFHRAPVAVVWYRSCRPGPGARADIRGPDPAAVHLHPGRRRVAPADPPGPAAELTQLGQRR
jgi:hypothetical protein